MDAAWRDDVFPNVENAQGSGRNGPEGRLFRVSARSGTQRI